MGCGDSQSTLMGGEGDTNNSLLPAGGYPVVGIS